MHLRRRTDTRTRNREHGLPAVVGTVHTTTQFVDGQIVTVDGTAGTVTTRSAD